MVLGFVVLTLSVLVRSCYILIRIIHGDSTQLLLLLHNGTDINHRPVQLIVLRHKTSTFAFHSYSRLDKKLWHVLGAIWPKFSKHLMREDFPGDIISHAWLSPRITALNDTNRWVAYNSKDLIYVDVPCDIISNLELSCIKALSETNYVVACRSKGCNFLSILTKIILQLFMKRNNKEHKL